MGTVAFLRARRRTWHLPARMEESAARPAPSQLDPELARRAGWNIAGRIAGDVRDVKENDDDDELMDCSGNERETREEKRKAAAVSEWFAL
jgi:hypothetical protein